MNILFVDQFGELGGAQQCLLDLMPAVVQCGWRAFAAVPGSGELAQRLRDMGTTVGEMAPGEYGLGSKSVGDAVRYAAAMPRLASELRRWIGDYQADLLYVNGPRLMPPASLAARHIPILFHAHSYLPAGISRTLLRWSLRSRRATVIAVSEFVAASLGGAVPDEQLTVIPNGVPDLRRERAPGSAPRIGVIGRIAAEKGQLDFVEAARLLPRDWKFVVCGAPVLAKPEYARRVRDSAAGLPVQFTGWRQDVSDALAGLDLLVVPSSPNEALGRVILEAFSAEVPVVAYDSGGIPELIEDGITGYLVQARTPHALAARIRTIIADAGGREAVARNARVRWETTYTLSRYRDRVTSRMARAAINASAAATANTDG